MYNFVSVNLDDTKSIIIKNLLELLETYDIDICCLQECYDNVIINSDKYKFIYFEKHFGLALLYKKTLDIKNINYINLPNDNEFKNKKYSRRYGLFFEYNNKIFCNTHLEIGERFITPAKTLVVPKILLKIIDRNYNIRTMQLKEILKKHPDYIIGDFNFNTKDKEYQFMLNNGWKTEIVDYTTPYETQVDFVFSKNKYKYFDKIQYPYSDHLPVICVI